MQDELDAYRRASAHRWIPDITFQEAKVSKRLSPNAGFHVHQVSLAARGKIVEANDSLIQAQQLLQ
jgi:hypothetical protein